MTSGIKQIQGDFSFTIKCYCQCPCHQEIILKKESFLEYERIGYPRYIIGHYLKVEQHKKEHSKIMKGHNSSPETQFKPNQHPWNKGLTKETDERVRIGAEKICNERHGMFGKVGAMKGRKQTEKQKEVHKIVLEKQRLNPELHPNRIMGKKGFVSKPQKKLFELLKEIYPDAELEYPLKIQNRNRFLDIGIPSLKLDFELDGVYWHKDSNTDSIRQIEIENVGWKVIRFTDKENLSLELIKFKLLELNIIIE